MDQAFDPWGQHLTSFAAWALFFHWLRNTEGEERLALVVCASYATLGEVFLSLVWGLYEYRLSNIPLFIPPGHALLFTMGVVLARKAPDWIVLAVPLAATPFVLLLAVTGLGTLDTVLFGLFLLCLLSGRAGRLYAVMFVLALAMEIYGTLLGNWRWSPEVPWFGLTAINPPLAAGAFYCVLDLLVVATVAAVRRPAVAPARFATPLSAVNSPSP
ncbi:MAG: hypothetical protein IT503_00020 [Burkholderiaceae bacterium]|nr:hypothetical protein [Burkholderiaceae bacterium]